jgi:hypothetical protein
MSDHVYAKKRSNAASRNDQKTDPSAAADFSASAFLRESHATAPAPMSPALLEKFEPGFGANFENIRISRGYIPPEAGVKAVARGTDILLDRSAGDDVLGHELAHVVQQASGRVPAGGFPVVNDPALEHEADVQGRTVASGGKAIGAGAESLGGGEMMPIAPMSAAQAPIQCKSKEDKDKSTIQKYGSKKDLSAKEQKKLDSARASMTQWAGQTEQKLGGKQQTTAEERSRLSKASTFLNAEAQRKLSSIPSDQMNLAVQGMADPRYQTAFNEGMGRMDYKGEGRSLSMHNMESIYNSGQAGRDFLVGRVTDSAAARVKHAKPSGNMTGMGNKIFNSAFREGKTPDLQELGFLSIISSREVTDKMMPALTQKQEARLEAMDRAGEGQTDNDYNTAAVGMATRAMQAGTAAVRAGSGASFKKLNQQLLSKVQAARPEYFGANATGADAVGRDALENLVLRSTMLRGLTSNLTVDTDAKGRSGEGSTLGVKATKQILSTVNGQKGTRVDRGIDDSLIDQFSAAMFDHPAPQPAAPQPAAPQLAAPQLAAPQPAAPQPAAPQPAQAQKLPEEYLIDYDSPEYQRFIKRYRKTSPYLFERSL